MTHLGEVVFRHVCTHNAHIRARRGYEPTDEATMAAFAKSWRRELRARTGRLATRFRTIQVGRSLHPLEVPMAQALLGEHLIPAAAQVRQIGVAVWR
jgi:hypothetical protein